MRDESIVFRLTEIGNAVTRTRDEYQSLIVLRDRLIMDMVNAGYSRVEVARAAGVRPNQISRMITGNRTD